MSLGNSARGTVGGSGGGNRGGTSGGNRSGRSSDNKGRPDNKQRTGSQQQRSLNTSPGAIATGGRKLGSASAVDEAARRDFVGKQLGTIARDPMVNRGLVNDLGKAMWDTRVKDATRVATGQKPRGNFGEVGPSSNIAGFRTLRDQAGISGKYTNAKGAQSFHTRGLAADLSPARLPGETDKQFNNRNASVAREIASNLAKDGITTWGGNWDKFKDYSHFQAGVGGKVDAAAKAYGGLSRDKAGIRTASIEPAGISPASTMASAPSYNSGPARAIGAATGVAKKAISAVEHPVKTIEKAARTISGVVPGFAGRQSPYVSADKEYSKPSYMSADKEYSKPSYVSADREYSRPAQTSVASSAPPRSAGRINQEVKFDKPMATASTAWPSTGVKPTFASFDNTRKTFTGLSKPSPVASIEPIQSRVSPFQGTTSAPPAPMAVTALNTPTPGPIAAPPDTPTKNPMELNTFGKVLSHLPYSGPFLKTMSKVDAVARKNAPLTAAVNPYAPGALATTNFYSMESPSGNDPYELLMLQMMAENQLAAGKPYLSSNYTVIG